MFDALTTLAFDYPRRAAFFRSELKDFLLLMQEQGISPLTPKGSFAGAMGVPQFMPGSYRRFAVDFDGDGRIDLWESSADVVGSVAHYLARHDWQAGQPVLLPATIDAAEQDAIARKLDGGISERRPMWSWEADGVTADPLASAVASTYKRYLPPLTSREYCIPAVPPDPLEPLPLAIIVAPSTWLAGPLTQASSEKVALAFPKSRPVIPLI